MLVLGKYIIVISLAAGVEYHHSNTCVTLKHMALHEDLKKTCPHTAFLSHCKTGDNLCVNTYMRLNLRKPFFGHKGY